MIRAAAVALLLLASATADATESVPVTLRGRTITLTCYRPPAGAPVRGTVLMASGDVGWVGLAVELAEYLAPQGYVVAGINVRQYLAQFTSGSSHLAPEQVPGDYGAMMAALRDRGMLHQPVIVSGVSEGAGLTVLAASSPANHAWIKGVITMGLPPVAELAWRWTDFTAWITKKDSGEPAFRPEEFIAKVAPLPLWMLQSTHDEYVTERDYRNLEKAARPPRRLVLIDASNHRFTDRKDELKKQFVAGLDWINLPS